MPTELKRCPFCGNDDVGLAFQPPRFHDESTQYFVVCNKCGCHTKAMKNAVNAEESWNRRADDGNLVNSLRWPFEHYEF